MTDPGSLVGAVSLTLQVVQGLKAYYLNNFKSFHEDADAVVERTERLEAILQLLQKQT